MKETTLEKWGIIGLKSNIKRRGIITEMYRYFLYFWFPLVILIKCRQCKNIITTQQFYGLIMAFYSKLFHLKKTYSLTVLTFIYKPKNSFLGNVYFRFIKYIVNSKYIDGIICYSEKEVGYYEALFGCKSGKFHFVQLGKSDESKSHILEKGDYLIAVGRSNRDYKWLISALTDTNYKLVIVNDMFSEQIKSDNIKVLKSCHEGEMLELMAKSFCVVVPLFDPNISAGQLVVLQAQNLHKPVIATESAGISDYIKDGLTGLIIKKNKKDLMAALEKLSDNAVYTELSTNGYNSFMKNYSVDQQFCSIGKIVKKYMK